MNKFQSFSTEDLVQELVRRRQNYIGQLDQVLHLWGDEAPGSAKVAEHAKIAAAATTRTAKAPMKKGASLKPLHKAKIRAKSAGGKKASKTHRPAGRTRGKGGAKGLDGYILDILRSERRAMKPKDFVPGLLKSGWATSSKDPAGLVKTYLNRMANSGRHPIEALGKNFFALREA